MTQFGKYVMKSFLVKLQNSFPTIILHQNPLVRDSSFLRVQLFYITVDRKSWVQYLQHKLLLACEIWSILIALIVNFHNVTFRIWSQSGSSVKYVRKIFRKTNISKSLFLFKYSEEWRRYWWVSLISLPSHY